MEINSDYIYLDKGGDDDHLPDTWKYFRVTGADGLGNLAGTLAATIQICRVKWPTLEDIPPVNDVPGITGYASAWDPEQSLNRLA